MADLDTRLSLYQSLVKLDEPEQIEDMTQQFSDRFGALPPEVNNLLYVIQIKILATRAGIESIATEAGQIIIRRFQGLHFDQMQLEPVPEGVKIGHTQIRLNPKRLGGEWKQVLEQVLRKIT